MVSDPHAHSAYLLVLAQAPEDFRIGLQAIYAGGSQVLSNLTLSNDVLWNCLTQQPWPNLEHFHLLGATRVSGDSGVTGIVRNCPKIKSIALVSALEPS
jgi:hypothetical protein